jgi:hypothetical protein
VAEADGCDDIGNVVTPRDQSRLAADHGVVDLTGILVTCVSGLDDFPTKLGSKLCDGFL